MLKAAHVAIAAAILYALFALGAFPTLAAVSACGQWEAMLRNLYEKYGETPAYIAVTGSGAVLTITVNEITHSFCRG